MQNQRTASRIRQIDARREHVEEIAEVLHDFLGEDGWDLNDCEDLAYKVVDRMDEINSTR